MGRHGRVRESAGLFSGALLLENARSYACAAALGCCLCATPAAATDWTPRLLPPASGEIRSPNDPIQLDLAGLQPDLLNRLYILIDAIDVTEFASIGGDVVTVALAVPLGSGAHEIELVELSVDGSLIVRGTWTVEIRRSGRFESAFLNANVTQNLTVRVADGNISDLPHRVQADGAADIEAAVDTGDFRAEGTAPFLWNTLEEVLAGDTGTVGPFLLTGEAGPATLRIGHHEPGPPSMALNAFNRRGLSLSLESERLRSSVTGFSLHGSQLVGLRGGLGVGDSDDRVSGVLGHVRALEGSQGSLDVTGVYLTGRAPQLGSFLSGAVGDSNVMEGSSWSVRAQADALEGRISALAEYAQTRSDFDGNSPSLKDGAHWVEFAVVPFPELQVREYPLSWRLTFNESQVGALFQSLGNPLLTQGRNTIGGTSDLYLAGLVLNAYGQYWWEDVVDDDIQPRMRSSAWGFDTSFTPADLLGGERRGALRWLGMPSFEGSYYAEHLEPHAIPTSFGDPGVLPHIFTQVGGAGLSFQYDRASWSIVYQIIDNDDRTAADFDTTLHQLTLRANAPLGDALSVAPFIQLAEEKRNDAADFMNLLAGLGVEASMIPERLGARVDVAFSRTRLTDRSVNLYDVVCSGSIDWRAIPALGNRPGLLLSLLGAYQGLTDRVFPAADVDAYQVFVRATLSWPVALGGR